MPNLLGKALKYVADGMHYAFADPGAASKARNNFTPMLLDMTRQSQFSAGETMDVDAHMRMAVTSAWIWSDVKLIADRCASHDADVEVRRRTGEDDEEVNNHPFERLLARPNSLMAGALMTRSLAWWYLLRGNAYVFISTQAPGLGEPQELWPLAANTIVPLPGSLHNGRGVLHDRQVIDYEQTIDGHKFTLPGENVVHFRTANPFDYWQGLSPLTAATIGVQTDVTQGKWTRDFFGRDNAVPSAIISLPKELSEDEFEYAKQQIKEQFSDGRKSAVTRAGDMSVQVITQTLEQMQIIASRQFNRDEIDRVYGVPQGLVSGGLSGDSRLAAEIAFARNTVQPLLDYMAAEWTLKAAPYYGADQYFIAAPNVIPQDRALEVAEYTQYAQDRTINENRHERNLDQLALNGELAYLQPLIDEIPVRLFQQLPLLAAVIKPPAPELPPPDETPMDEQTPGIGAMAGQQQPEEETSEMVGKATRDIAIKAELERWRRVAVKEARAGRAPGARAFTSAIIPEAQRRQIASALADCVTEEDVKAAFGIMPAMDEPDIKTHMPETAIITCPLCRHGEVDRYADHGGLCVCKACGCTFDPAIEVAP